MHEVLQPRLQVGKSGDVLKAAVGERGAMVALGRSEPTERATEAMEVVVQGEDSKGVLSPQPGS
jgi:hypothetical protein